MAWLRQQFILGHLLKGRFFLGGESQKAECLVTLKVTICQILAGTTGLSSTCVVYSSVLEAHLCSSGLFALHFLFEQCSCGAVGGWWVFVEGVPTKMCVYIYHIIRACDNKIIYSTLSCFIQWANWQTKQLSSCWSQTEERNLWNSTVWGRKQRICRTNGSHILLSRFVLMD